MIRLLAIIFGVLLIIAIIIFVVQAIRRPGEEPVDLNVNLDEIKPAAWTPYAGGLQRVNLDGDEDVEWLLLYRYDGGQIGGVIYDAQSAPRGENVLTIPQTPSYLVPYRLLPDYAKGKSVGYLGDLEADWKQLSLDPSMDVNADLTQPRDVLLVRGKREGGLINRYSYFKWVSLDVGYAGAHASTPGWFSLSKDDPQDWTYSEEWVTNNQVTTEIWAWEPQTDRSAICRRAKWLLEPSDLPDNPIRFVGNYDDSDLIFCGGNEKIPKEPAYPEAQLLAYLLEGGANRERVDEEVRESMPSFQQVKVLRLTAPPVLDEYIGEVVQAVGEVDFKSEDGFHAMYWTARMIPPESIKETTKWRLTSLIER
ncbi:MAG: hypothetical protein GXP42_10705 [Chloroflexi bacterium]|nr:hypothetical protein [Chloroflexota bacterium]